MARFFVGLCFGIILAFESVVLTGAGHGTYAPLVFTSSLLAFVPVLGLFTGPPLWAIYFVLIPNLDEIKTRLIVLSTVMLAHLIPGFWLAAEDPAFARADKTWLVFFGISFVASVGVLMFSCFRKQGLR
jgi:hypothetical protein